MVLGGNLPWGNRRGGGCRGKSCDKGVRCRHRGILDRRGKHQGHGDRGDHLRLGEGLRLGNRRFRRHRRENLRHPALRRRSRARFAPPIVPGMSSLEAPLTLGIGNGRCGTQYTFFTIVATPCELSAIVANNPPAQPRAIQSPRRGYPTAYTPECPTEPAPFPNKGESFPNAKADLPNAQTFFPNSRTGFPSARRACSCPPRSSVSTSRTQHFIKLADGSGR